MSGTGVPSSSPPCLSFTHTFSSVQTASAAAKTNTRAHFFPYFRASSPRSLRKLPFFQVWALERCLTTRRGPRPPTPHTSRPRCAAAPASSCISASTSPSLLSSQGRSNPQPTCPSSHFHPTILPDSLPGKREAGAAARFPARRPASSLTCLPLLPRPPSAQALTPGQGIHQPSYHPSAFQFIYQVLEPTPK